MDCGDSGCRLPIGQRKPTLSRTQDPNEVDAMTDLLLMLIMPVGGLLLAAWSFWLARREARHHR